VRLLQVNLGAGEIVDLHPYVSVVSGFGDARHRTIIETVRGLAAGRATVEGLVEAHGVFLDLTPDNLALLDLDGADLDPVVRAPDLPSLGLQTAERHRRAVMRGLQHLDRRLADSRHRPSGAAAAL
jgi:hypothetical protein